ncbi:hypothetical protein EGJ27_02905 [Pseudomonas sp. v388]|uniref:hypothetical protein n=1 Tax=Pseudomonas sp. v388 TaxID=2479849 RepID=UPI000F795D9E|nr:hypothetical protein [Pseudomonas sp. v388]RRV10580.1 hypothetical protein EGJ27_02905 [Pseudomonas sp. v388]
MLMLGLALTISGAWTGIRDGWPVGYLLMLMGGVLLGAAALCNREQHQTFNESLGARLNGHTLSKLPGYRLLFYAFFIGLACLGGVIAVINELLEAWRTGQLEVFTGPKGHRVLEVVTSELEPWRFRLNLIGDLLLLVVCGAGLAFAARCVLLGRRAFK